MGYRVKVYETEEMFEKGLGEYAYAGNEIDDLDYAISIANSEVGDNGISIVFDSGIEMKYIKNKGRYIRPLFKNEENELARRLSVVVAKVKAMGYSASGLITEIDGTIYLGVDGMSIKMSNEGKILGAYINKQKVDLKGDIEMLTRYFQSFINNLDSFPVLLNSIHFHGEESLRKLNVECKVETEGLTVIFD